MASIRGANLRRHRASTRTWPRTRPADRAWQSPRGFRVQARFGPGSHVVNARRLSGPRARSTVGRAPRQRPLQAGSEGGSRAAAPTPRHESLVTRGRRPLGHYLFDVERKNGRMRVRQNQRRDGRRARRGEPREERRRGAARREPIGGGQLASRREPVSTKPSLRNAPRRLNRRRIESSRGAVQAGLFENFVPGCAAIAAGVHQRFERCRGFTSQAA